MSELAEVANPASDAAKPSGGAPLATFDPAGHASVINYQTPESLSYEGKHVLLLGYGVADFASVIAPTAPGTPGTPGSVTGTPGSVTGTPSAPAAPDPAAFVTAPRAVVLSDKADPANPLIALAPFERAARLDSLTWADVTTAAAANKRIEVYRSISGKLDYRIRDLSQPDSNLAPDAGNVASLLAPLAAGARNAELPRAIITMPVGGTGAGAGEHAFVAVSITSPDASNPSLSGPASGLQLPVSGTVTSTAGQATVTVDLFDSKHVSHAHVTATVTGGSWHAKLPVTASGTWVVQAGATAERGELSDADSVTIYVTLGGGSGGSLAIAPSVAITSPPVNAVIISLDATAKVDASALAHVAGTADTCGGSAVSVTLVMDDGTTVSPDLTAAGGTTSSFDTQVLLTGDGWHTITATAVNQDGIAAPAVSVNVQVAAQQPIRPLARRLLLIEKLAITSFLGNFGAGRLVKTLTLLPGEQTVISVDSYTKDDSTLKSASSILDSTASECAADFEDTVNNENDTKASNSDATTASVSADVGANWGWGNASIKASYTDQANASRENTAKTVTNALAKHTSKASSNRTVTVNTDFSQTISTGNTTDTTRTLKNINVSRVLNFIFRQMTQEHIAIIHMTDATVGYYALDLLLNAKGDPQQGPNGELVTQERFTEYTLPEISTFAQREMVKGTNLQGDILTVLSAIPDYTGTQQSLIEVVTPTAPDGTPNPQATYVRVRPNMTSTYTTASGEEFQVPGIILGATTCIMRTDQLLCDALLGEGDALDTYSHALQDVAVTERQVAVAERSAAVARENLAQSIIAKKDADMAGLWQKVFPAPLSVPATVTVPATPNGAQSTSGG